MNIIISGALGAMGRVVSKNAPNFDINVVAGVSLGEDSTVTYPIYSSFESCKEKADAIIDFSHPSNLPSLLKFATENKIPAVIATTGMSDKDLEMINEAAAIVPIFFTFNMSLGVNLLCELSKKAASILGTAFDVEIVEKHHNQKVDAPSGTAIMLANSVKEGLPYEPELVYNRQPKREKRAANEIGMHAIRGGTIVGEHDVLFCGLDEVITLSHSASSKSVFAIGALKASQFITTVSQPRIYSMKDMISL